MKVEKMTKMKIPATHNKSGYVIRYFCPRCGGDMEKCGYAPAMGEEFKGDYQCMTCGYEENIGHFKKQRIKHIQEKRKEIEIPPEVIQDAEQIARESHRMHPRDFMPFDI